MNTTKKTGYDKKEKWALHTYYQIYMEDNMKMIRIIGSTDRADTGKAYLSWICMYYGNDCVMPLDHFLEWDVYYQLDSLIKNNENAREIEVEPQECYWQANAWIKADGNGSILKNFLDLTENTPCGYYYGF